MKCCLRLLAMLCALTLMLGAACAEGFEPLPYGRDAVPYAPHAECYLPDNAGYHDDSLDIRIETFRKDDTTVMVAYVTIADPTQLRTGFSNPKTPTRQSTNTVARIAKRYQAVLAINGDFFSYHNQGFVVRNGETFRRRYVEGRETLIIDEKGDFTIIRPTTEEAIQAFEGEIIHAFCFGPGLVVNGEQLTDIESVTMDIGKYKQTQRMAICQLGPLSYMLVTCEGPENKDSVGFTLLQMAETCKELGAVNAYNLDGGSSSSMALDYKKINGTSSKKERPVGDVIYFCTLVP